MSLQIRSKRARAFGAADKDIYCAFSSKQKIKIKINCFAKGACLYSSRQCKVLKVRIFLKMASLVQSKRAFVFFAGQIIGQKTSIWSFPKGRVKDAFSDLREKRTIALWMENREVNSRMDHSDVSHSITK